MTTWPAPSLSPGRKQNLRGPLRALTYDEQLEIRRTLAVGRRSGNGVKTGIELAQRYGVSLRTIWRYAKYTPLPPATEFLRSRLTRWSVERDIRLSRDDMETLLYAVLNHPIVKDWSHRDDAE